jgi:hypothetical protein
VLRARPGASRRLTRSQVGKACPLLDALCRRATTVPRFAAAPRVASDGVGRGTCPLATHVLSIDVTRHVTPNPQ